MLRRCVVLFTVAVALIGQAMLAGEGDLVAVSLASPREQYLLGEPVLLDISIRNSSAGPFKAFLIPDDYIQVFVGPEGTSRGLINPSGADNKLALTPATLEPKETWSHHLRVIHNVRSDSQGRMIYELALPKPGNYAINISLPLMLADPGGVETKDTNRYYKSNVIRIRVKMPVGDDAKIYEAIKDGDSGHFLRTGRPLTGSGLDHATALKMARLLRKYPRTGYRYAMRHALLEFARFSQGGLKQEDQELIDRVLGEGPG